MNIVFVLLSEKTITISCLRLNQKNELGNSSLLPPRDIFYLRLLIGKHYALLEADNMLANRLCGENFGSVTHYKTKIK